MFGLEDELQDRIKILEEENEEMVVHGIRMSMDLLEYIQEGGGIEGSNVDRWYNNKYDSEQLFQNFLKNLRENIDEDE